MEALLEKKFYDIDNVSIKIEKSYECDLVSIDDCKKYIEEYKSSYYFDGEFKDDIWTVKNARSDNFIHYKFSDLLGDSKEKVKKYLAIKLCNLQMEPQNLKVKLNSITKYLIYTNNFQEKYLFSFMEMTKKANLDSVSGVYEYLKFIGEGQPYLDYIETLNWHDSTSRNIPGFESTIIIDKIVNDVILNHKDIMDKYYVVILFWKITTIIPIRPIEFIQLKKNCIYKDNNICYLHIDRKKNKQNKRIYHKPIINDFKIDEEIYSLIQGFKDKATYKEDDLYLIPYDWYIENHNIRKRKNRNFNYDDMNNLFFSFQENVVSKEYGYEIVELDKKEKKNQIEKIHLGDTRHLAIINMMMQGINPLTIMQIAGHRSLDTQMGYCSHVEKFMTSKTFVLSRLLKSSPNINVQLNNDFSIKMVDKELLGLKFYDLPIVACGSGRCTNENFPYECMCEECLFCSYYIPEINNMDNYIEELQKQNEKDIMLKRNSLEFVLKNANLVYQEDLEQKSKDYATSLNKETVIQSYRLLRKEFLDE